MTRRAVHALALLLGSGCLASPGEAPRLAQDATSSDGSRPEADGLPEAEHPDSSDPDLGADAEERPDLPQSLVEWAIVTLGDRFGCGLVDGTAYCWGLNDRGQLGRAGEAMTSRALRPVPAAVGRELIALSAGRDFVCGIEAGTNLPLCWGNNNAGQRGPLAAADGFGRPDSERYSQIAAGTAHACGVHANGVTCWGSNAWFQTSHPDAGAVDPFSLPATAGTRAVAVGATTSCLLDSGNALKCWGKVDHIIDTTDACSDVGTCGEPVALQRAQTWVVALGVDHACARAGQTVCWGSNLRLLGTGGITGKTGDTEDEFYVGSVHVNVPGGDVPALSAGADHNCAINDAGAMYCWGYNSVGELGNSLAAPGMAHNIPIAVKGNHVWKSVAAGYAATCGVTVGGALYCWGSGVDGALGLGDEESRQSPTKVEL